MSARMQAALGFLAGAAIDLSFYAGLYATLGAAAVATGTIAWWRLR